MAVLKFQAYNGNDVNGTALGELTEAFMKRVGLEDNAVGNGQLHIHPSSSQADWVAQGNFVKVWRDTIAGSAIAGFWIEAGGDTLLSTLGVGGQKFARGGRGPIAALEEVIVWHVPVSGGSGQVQKSKGRWLWKNAHPARVLVRLLEEAKARNGIQDVTWDFTRTLDSDAGAWDLDEYADRFNIPIGMNLLEVVGVMRDAGLHITMSPDLVLSAREEPTNDLTATIQIAAGTDIRETSEREIVASVSKSVVLVGGENRDGEIRYRKTRDSGVETALGRRKEGFFPYPRTSKAAWLNKVAQRKINRWKKQWDGPFTLGVLDKLNQVAGVDYTVGDNVEVDIPGQYDTTSERVVGITLVEGENGEYDPIVDFGDQMHDPVSGQYLGGDSEGVNPCGCGSTGGKPGKGGDGGDPDGPGDGDGPGGGGSNGADTNMYVFEDWGAFYNASAGRIPPEPGDYLDVITRSTGTEHDIILPDGADGFQRIIILFGTTTDDDDDPTTPLEALGWTTAASTLAPVGWSFVCWKRIDGTEGHANVGHKLRLTTVKSEIILVHAVILDSSSEVEAATSATDDPPSNDVSWSTSDPTRWYAFGVDDQAITGLPTGYSAVGAAGVGFGGQVSDPVIDAEADTDSTGAVHTINLPDGSDQIGKVLCLVMSWQGTSENLGSLLEADGQFTEEFGQGTAGTLEQSVVYRRITGTEGWPKINASVPFSHVTDANRLYVHAFLIDGVAELDTEGMPINASLTTGTTIGSLTPTSGFTEWASTDRALYISVAAADDAVTGEHTDYTEADKRDDGVNLWTVISTHADDSTNQAPSPDRTFDGSNQVQALIAFRGAGLAHRLGFKDGDGTTEDPSAFTGSGTSRSFTVGVRSTYGLGPGRLFDPGHTPTREVTDAWWGGSQKWLVFKSGVDAMGIVEGPYYRFTSLNSNDRGQIYMSSAETGAFGRDGREPFSPIDTREFIVETDFKIDLLGNPAHSWSRYWDWVMTFDERELEFQVRLGDGGFAEGIRLLGDTSEFVAVPLSVDELWTFKWYWSDAASKGYAKIWKKALPEPSVWMVEIALEPNLNSGDIMGLRCIIGNTSGPAMNLDISEIRMQAVAASGASVSRFRVGRGDGVTTTFDLGHSFEVGTLLVWVDGFAVTPTSEDPDGGTFTLSRAPYGDAGDPDGGALIEVSYTRG